MCDIPSYGKMLGNRKTFMRTSLILHGHFYQPPRENPATDLIPKQPSASPYEDWNERIYHDCYGANTHSRYLSPGGRILSLTNNFSFISFNFGHTLLKWIEEFHPDTHEKIIEADKLSIERLGHGNAMAQGYNHTILPLDSIENARLQIAWGIEDFILRYGRDPEGMWLPEAGINENVIDLLSEAGIKFVVLSPWQCKAVEDDKGTLTDLNGKSAPYDRPYILTGTTGKTISAFFYHPGLAESISFGHALTDADALYQNLLKIKDCDKRDLIHTATDGEIYGHHEPFGDMALAALIRKVGEREDFKLTNYGAFLASHPATLHATLHAGEDGKGTSWSCCHGVSRWYKDCGCHTGGEESWNQAWRTPLRTALNNLAEKLELIFDDEVQRIFSGALSPYCLLIKASAFMCNKESMHAFLAKLHNDYQFDESNDAKIAHLLSGAKYKHFSFTSCAFFFSDLSGIETRQNIKYALYAIKLFQRYNQGDLLRPFLSDLRMAKSNIKQQGNGMSIAQEEMKDLNGESEAALFFFLNRLFARKEEYQDNYGKYLLKSIKIEDNDNFEADILNDLSMELFHFSALASSSIDNGLNLYFCENDSENHPINRFRVTNENITERMLDAANIWIDNNINGVDTLSLDAMTRNLRHYAMLVKNNNYIPMETQMIENLGICLKTIKALLFSSPVTSWDEKKTNLDILIDFIKKCGRPNELKVLMDCFNQDLRAMALDIAEKGLSEDLMIRIRDLLELSRNHGYEPDCTKLQNCIYPYYTKEICTDIPASELHELFQSLNFE